MRAIRFLGVVSKELRQLSRDPRMYPIILLAPILQLFLYGYAATFDLKELPVALLDRDRTAESRAVVARLEATGDFRVAREVGTIAEIEALLVRGEARVGLAFEPGFGRRFREARGAQVGVYLDGADSNTATIAKSSIEASLALQGIRSVADERRERDTVAASTLERLEGPDGLPEALEVRSRVFYNPELKSVNYMVPGVIVLILSVMTMMLSSLSVVKEKEIGTFEMLLATPIRPRELIAGKLAPFVAIGFLDVVIVLATAAFWFRVPIHGSVGLLLVFSANFVMTTIALGLLVSTFAQSQQQAMIVSFMVLLPMILLSGFIFPTDSMPRPVQIVSYALPMRYFLEAVRAIFLRGVGLDVLWPQMALLGALGATLLGAAIARFRKRVG